MRDRHARIKITPMDVMVGLAATAAASALFYRLRVSLHYDWHWAVIPQFLVRYDEGGGQWVPNLLLQGLLTTARLSVWGTVLATFLGGIMGLFLVGRSLFRRMIAHTYVELARNLPPLVLVFIFYYFVSDQIMPVVGVDDWVRELGEPARGMLGLLFAPPRFFSAFLSATVTLAVFEGAYIAEIVRAGVQAIDRGQWESAFGLGMTRFQVMRHVVGPQAIRRILPPLAGQFISTIKDSAIVSVISIQELTFQGMELMAATRLTFEIWITVTLMYLVLTLALSLAVERLEIRMRRPGT